MSFGRMGGMGRGFGRLGSPLGGVTTPSWVSRNRNNVAAILGADNINSRYWANGQSYPDEATFNTAALIQSSGVTRQIGPYVLPAATEKISNTTFPDTTGWSVFASSGTPSIAANSGELVLTGNSASTPIATTAVTVQANKAYAYTGNFRKGASGDATARIKASSSNTGTPTFATQDNTTTTPVAGKQVFGAEGDGTLYVGLQQTSATSTGTARLGSPSVKECLPCNGFVEQDFGAKIVLVSPASLPGSTIVLANCGLDSERSRIRFTYSTAGVVTAVLTYANTTLGTQAIGTVATSTEFTVEFGYYSGRFYVWAIDGSQRYYLDGTYPPIGKIFLGRSPTGETWTGTIKEWWVYPSASRPLLGDLWLEGDSYTAGIGAGTVGFGPDLAQRSFRNGYTTAVGGSSPSAIATRIGSNTQYWGKKLVIWDGDANGVTLTPAATGATEWCDAIYNAINAAGITDFLIIPPAVYYGASSDYQALAEAIRDECLVRSPTKVIDWRSTIPNTGGVINLDQMYDYPTDTKHLSQAAIDLMANAVKAVINA